MAYNSSKINNRAYTAISSYYALVQSILSISETTIIGDRGEAGEA